MQEIELHFSGGAVFTTAPFPGVFMAYIYSAPPLLGSMPCSASQHLSICLKHVSVFPRLKLKQNWISGCYALGSSYIALPWLAGQCTFGEADYASMS